ncbi:S-adenosyl-L-methionine-dependent methyltransferase [Ascodesmis nigricans]|uniref:S-adenosyl-L-methionine-dependent methyltransferase n=1 Tax=Ascodesmis nigricans TaxID=341454 RepID=A0A4S2MWQ0_9PEZI|nr:S-adenosyl-L-methionine-dependent methyltransferase [Ascodesmis nigricans]
MSPLLAFTTGILLGLLLPFLHRFVTSTKNLYTIDHAVLNLIPPSTLWMNFGLWDSSTSTLNAASTNLLRRLLHNAAIPASSHILDLGFGCGDQSLHLLALEENYTYTGITLAPAQFEVAKSRLPEHTEKCRIFCADAARPETWGSELLERVDLGTAKKKVDWVLALDCMYHFRPSREGIVAWAGARKTGFAAFDLLRREELVGWDEVVLRVICWLAGIPWSNMVTVEEYKGILRKVGGFEVVEVEDVTESALGGMARFVWRQDQELKRAGVRGGVGKYRAAGWLFGWLARKGVLRACLVVARRGKVE